MKVVVTGTRGIPNVMGGVETHCEELCPRLARLGADVTVVRLFALFHDCKREDDGYDETHGERGAAFAKECFEKGLLDITQEQFDKLYHACFYHTKEHQTDDPTINTCYDADRLDLGRVGMSLNPKKMATAPGARIAHKSLRANVDVYEMREWLKTIVL